MRRLFTFKRIAIGIAATILLWLICSYAVVKHYIHRLEPMHNEAAPAIDWGTVQTVRLKTIDGEQLGAWFIEGQANQPVVVLLHGNGSCRSGCLNTAETISKSGRAVLMVTLCAHGDSTGDLNDFGYSTRHDVVSAVDWIAQNYPGRAIIVWGQSLGAAAAVFAGEELGEKVRGYILECPYRNLRSAVWNRLKMHLPPVLNAVAYAGMLIVSPLLPDVDRISLVDAVGKIPRSVPVLIMAGSLDQRAPPADAQAIADRIPDHSLLLMFNGADHLQLQAVDPQRYSKAILLFLAGPRSSSNPG